MPSLFDPPPLLAPGLAQQASTMPSGLLGPALGMFGSGTPGLATQPLDKAKLAEMQAQAEQARKDEELRKALEKMDQAYSFRGAGDFGSEGGSSR